MADPREAAGGPELLEGLSLGEQGTAAGPAPGPTAHAE